LTLKSLLIITLAAHALSAAGCSRRATPVAAYRDSVAAPPEPLIKQVQTVGRYGGRFVLGQTVNPKTFNDLMATETSSADITNRIFTTLVFYNNLTQQFEPELAKSWETSPDGISWTFHLRKGAAFSDSHPITADDVLFSFAVAFDPTLHPGVQDLLKVGGKNFEVSAPDPYTVVINTLRPNSALLDTLCTGGLTIMPRHVLESAFKDGSFASAYNTNTPPDKLVTSGAWRVVQYVPGEKTVLGRNPYYFGYDQANHRLPYLNELVFLTVPDQDAADLKFRAGELHALENTKPENYRWYDDHQKEADFTLYRLGPEQNGNFFWFNLNKVQPPLPGEKPLPGRKVGEPFVGPVKYSWFDNPIFRRAVSMAVDRDAMIPSIFFGHGLKSWSMSTESNKVWFTPGLVHDDYNLAESKRLLASLGWKDSDGDGVLEDAHGHPVSFTIKTNSDNTLRIGMANFVKDDLAKVGINVALVPVDFNTLVTNLRSDFQYDSILLGLQSGVPPSPANGQNVWRSSGETHNWFIRQQKPDTPQEARIDQLLDEILTNQDLEAEKKAWKEIQTIINEQAWLIWLPIRDYALPASNKFGNLQPSIMAHRVLWNIDRVYMKASNPS
jgi:peptide/nickel transport system substrate-binding protein